MKTFLVALGTGGAAGTGIGIIEHVGYLAWMHGVDQVLGDPLPALVGAGLGAVGGVLTGFFVWLARPKSPLPTGRLLVTRGLVGAVALLLTLVLVAGVFGYIQGPNIAGHAPPAPFSLEGFFLFAFLAGLVGAVPVSFLGLTVGAIVAFVIRQFTETYSDLTLDGKADAKLFDLPK